MNSSPLLLDALQGKMLSRIPFWFMRQAGRYLPEYRELRASAGSFLDLCYTPSLAAEVTLQPIRRFDMDAAILFSDILVVPQALGLKLEFLENHGPKLQVLENEQDLAKLSKAKLLSHLQPVFETIERVRGELPADKALIGFAGSPWTVACYMLSGGSHDDFDKARLVAATQPQFLGKLIELLVEATGDYLAQQIKSGVQAVQLFDSWSGLLGEDGFERFVTQPTARIVARLKKEFPHIPIIGFPRLAGVKIMDYVAKTGVDGVSLDTSFSVAWAAKNLPARCCPQGNLDPFLLVAGGDALKRGMERIVEGMQGRNFIFNLGHGMMPSTPVAHVAQLCQWLKEAR